MEMTRPSQILRVLEISHVSPPPGSVPDSVVPLTFFDVLWLHDQLSERVFFYHYHNSTSHFIDSTLPNLKSSLSLTLQHFYPLAGKLRRTPLSEDRHEIVYSDGDSVPFTVAECHEDFHEISGCHACDVHTIAPLLARLPKADDGFQPLLAMQVTVFPEYGVAVSVTMHHAAGDGSATMSFLSWWAACCRSGGSAAAHRTLPSFDRSTIPDPPGLYSFISNLLFGKEDSIIATTDSAQQEKVIAYFTLGADHAKKLKELAMSRASQGDTTTDSFHCSTLVVTLAYVWVCLVRTRSYPFDKPVLLCLSANCRSAMQPLLPPEYFGNCLQGIIAKAKAGDLVDRDGFLAAAKALGKAVKAYKEEGAQASLERYMEMVDVMRHGAISLVSSSPKFGVYSLMDLGWGRPKQAEFASVVRTGAMAMSESREGGAGGVEVGFALPKHEIDAFATRFSHGLELLLQ